MIDEPIDSNKIPKHVAIIMDGNGRWAKKRKMPRVAGHRAGVDSVRKIVKACGEKGIKVLTLFAFSSENWRRPQQEVGLLMDLFMTVLNREAKKLHKNNVQLRVVGDLSAFSPKLQSRIADAMELTKNNDGVVLNIAANYGGHWDIVHAAQKVAEEVKAGTLAVEDISEAVMTQHMSFPDLPELDLFIRTGGEVRVSNFLLWQIAYAELYFSEVLWPDFDENEFGKALASFAKRQRRFGKTGDQIEENEGA